MKLNGCYIQFDDESQGYEVFKYVYGQYMLCGLFDNEDEAIEFVKENFNLNCQTT